ncbi:MAG: hypothetical protein DRJ64_00285 [Thermoprotei archaeon]|nr:MAG: hypothetical protein DRJ64_00285 [Thermoprotei archaeon]
MGRGLATRWLLTGHEIMIGSRSMKKAKATVEKLVHKVSDKNIRRSIRPTTYQETVQYSELVVLSVPYWALEQTLESIKSLVTQNHIILLWRN